MSRILAIDYGKKRTGIAVSDPLQIIANGLTTIPSNSLFDFLHHYLIQEKVECIVVGYPLQTDGTESVMIPYIKPVLRQLRKTFPHIKIEIEDERFTSKIAYQTIRTGGVKKMKRRNKAMVDTISATLILQTYMEKKKNLS